MNTETSATICHANSMTNHIKRTEKCQIHTFSICKHFHYFKTLDVSNMSVQLQYFDVGTEKNCLAPISPFKTSLNLLQSFAFSLRDKHSSEDDIESTQSWEHPECPCTSYGILKETLLIQYRTCSLNLERLWGKYITVSSP